MPLNDLQKQQLLAPLDANRVLSKDGQSHLAVWDVRRWLNRIFGIAGWSAEVTEMVLTYEDKVLLRNGKPGFEVGYRATVRLTIYDYEGDQSKPAYGVLAQYSETAFGGQRMGENSRGDLHDFAIKTAESQALKRAAINLGDQFGLSLYDQGGRANVNDPTKLAPVVVRTLAWASGDEPATTDGKGMEHDDHAVTEAEELETHPEVEAHRPDPEPEEPEPATSFADDAGLASREALRDALLEAGKKADARGRRTAVTKLSLTIGALNCESEVVPGLAMTFGLLRDQALEGAGVGK